MQIQQVLLNLVRNAVDATARSGDKSQPISIRTSLDKRDVVRIAVADHGCGLTPEEAGRIFDPLFTTKSSGMGLGLSISRSIVAAHGAELGFEQNSPGGTTFHFSLPTAVVE